LAPTGSAAMAGAALRPAMAVANRSLCMRISLGSPGALVACLARLVQKCEGAPIPFRVDESLQRWAEDVEARTAAGA
jgi:hypothetical protein